MSMNGVWERIQGADLERLVNLLPDEPSALRDYWGYWKEQPEPPRRLDVRKNWSDLHFLLNATTETPLPASATAVFGGEEIGHDAGYGPARYLTPQKVNEVAVSLQSLSIETVSARYDPTAMTAAGLYPGGGWDFPENKAEVLLSFIALQRFYLEATQAGDGMLLFLR